MGEQQQQSTGGMWLLFTVGEVGCAVPAEQVDSIALPPARLTHTPGSPPATRGLFPHGGEIAVVIDLRQKFGLEANPGRGRLLLSHQGEQLLALQIDSVLGLHRREELQAAPLPPDIPRQVFDAALMHERRMLLVSDCARLAAMPITSLPPLPGAAPAVAPEPPPAATPTEPARPRAPTSPATSPAPAAETLPPPHTAEAPRAAESKPPATVPAPRPPRAAPAATVGTQAKAQPTPTSRPSPGAAPHPPMPPPARTAATLTLPLEAPPMEPLSMEPEEETASTLWWPLLAMLGGGLALLLILGQELGLEWLTGPEQPRPVPIAPRPVVRPPLAAEPPALPTAPSEPTQTAPAPEPPTQAETPPPPAEPAAPIEAERVHIERDAEGISLIIEQAAPTQQPAASPKEAAPTPGPVEKPRGAEPSTVAATPTPAPRVQRLTHIVVRGDTLWSIAKRYVKDPLRYKELAENSNIRNPDLIYPGDKIRIIIRQSGG